MTRLLCERCRKKCRGDVLKVANKYFHKSCFTCSRCQKNLATGGFFMKDDEFYCQEDYQKCFIAKCRVCSKDLVGEIVTVLNFSFHCDCFKCVTCSVTFHPGDRVTLWNDNFFCPNCIQKESVPIQRSSPHPKPKENGTTVSPTSVTDDEGCISAADVSPNGLASPHVNVPHTPSKYVKLGNVETSGVTSTDLKCITSLSNPQTSKSILRKAGGDDVRVRSSSRERCYWSTDSGLGEKVFDSKNINDIHDLSQSQEPASRSDFYPSTNKPTTLAAASCSRQNLIARVPNSDYGRFYTQSYAHLNEPSTPTAADQYKRNVSFAATGSQGKLKHFHIPEAKSRFLPPGVRTHSLLFGQPVCNSTLRSSTPRQDFHSPRRVLTKQVAHSAMELISSPPVSCIQNGLTNGITHSNERICQDGGRDEEHTVAIEARRLACFPGGHERDRTVPVPIERVDWPAPPASAVVLAELMRERRFRRREEARQTNGSIGDGVDDFESQEALSIDCSFDGHFGPADTSTVRRSSGITKALFPKEAEEKRRCKSQLIDPVSASRSPNAAVEPIFKPRFSTHQFACNPVRPGYTGGRLTQSSKTTSLPASSLLLHSIPQDTSRNDWHRCEVNGHDLGVTQRALSPTKKAYFHSVHAIGSSQPKPFNGNGLRGLTSTPRLVENGVMSQSGDQHDSTTYRSRYPNVVYTPTPSSAFYRSAPPAPKRIPYDQLRTFRDKTPKGIDRTTLETHLSEEEFERVFLLTRSAFYHLPEWKRNDLKRRAELF